MQTYNLLIGKVWSWWSFSSATRDKDVLNVRSSRFRLDFDQNVNGVVLNAHRLARLHNSLHTISGRLAILVHPVTILLNFFNTHSFSHVP